MIDRGNAGQVIGEALLGAEQHAVSPVAPGESRERCRGRCFQAAIQPVRLAIRRALRRGQACGCRKTAGTCKELLAHEEWLWTFVRCGGGGADQQRRGAGGAARGIVAQDERGNGQPAREPVRGAGADGSSHLPPARQERVGLLGRLHHGLAVRPSAACLCWPVASEARPQLPFAGWATNRADGSLSTRRYSSAISIPAGLFAL